MSPHPKLDNVLQAHLSTGDPEVDKIDMDNLPACAIKFFIAELHTTVASPVHEEVIILYIIHISYVILYQRFGIPNVTDLAYVQSLLTLSCP